MQSNDKGWNKPRNNFAVKITTEKDFVKRLNASCDQRGWRGGEPWTEFDTETDNHRTYCYTFNGNNVLCDRCKNILEELEVWQYKSAEQRLIADLMAAVNRQGAEITRLTELLRKA